MPASWALAGQIALLAGTYYAAARFALLLAMSLLFIGVIMVAFRERKRGLHDMLAGTYVVKSE